MTNDTTTIQLKDDVREELRDYQRPDESANDAVARLMSDGEPASIGVDEAQAERIAERVVERELQKVQSGSHL